MKNGVPSRSSFNPRAFAGFVLFCAVLAGLIALHSRWIGMALALIYFCALVVGSLVVLVRNLRGRREAVYLGQAAALPKSWRKWVLDEDDVKRG